jgi:hypothetical protein
MYTNLCIFLHFKLTFCSNIRTNTLQYKFKGLIIENNLVILRKLRKLAKHNLKKYREGKEKIRMLKLNNKFWNGLA